MATGGLTLAQIPQLNRPLAAQLMPVEIIIAFNADTALGHPPVDRSG